jgi:hypothetical protein
MENDKKVVASRMLRAQVYYHDIIAAVSLKLPWCKTGIENTQTHLFNLGTHLEK